MTNDESYFGNFLATSATEALVAAFQSAIQLPSCRISGFTWHASRLVYFKVQADLATSGAEFSSRSFDQVREEQWGWDVVAAVCQWAKTTFRPSCTLPVAHSAPVIPIPEATAHHGLWKTVIAQRLTPAREDCKTCGLMLPC